VENRCEYSTLTLPNDPHYISVALAYVGQVSEKFGFDDKKRDSIQRAVQEAISNVIKHAFEPSEKARFEISCDRIPLGLRVTVKDMGLPFDPTTAPECELPLDPDSDPGPGCGILSMQESMDEVHFNNLGAGGKETVLIKYLDNKNIANYVDACELEPFSYPDGTESSHSRPIDITIRAMEPSEAIEISKCMYKAYGYTYVYGDMYYPERIVELNASGEVFSAVAVTTEQEVAGHAALMYHENGLIAETGMGVVKPEFRSLGIIGRLEEFLVEKGKSQGLTGIFGRPVTTHTFTQQVGRRFHTEDCAVLLGNMPQTESFRGITEELSQRETLLIHFMYLEKPPSSPLFSPPHHREIIHQMYKNFAVDMEEGAVQSAGDTVPDQDARVRTQVVESLSFARIDVESYGENAATQVKAILRELCTKPIDIIHIYLNLNDPYTSVFCERFEELGFFFSGILPLALPGDALILQYLNNVPIDYSKINIESEFGQKLLSYVRKHDPLVRLY
jgi:anti-sigma regulatory factor (Ser/Thr protein kinase)